MDDSIKQLKKYPVGSFLIHEEEWQESIRALSPLPLWVAPEGLYIKTKERFVDVWGIFIPRQDIIKSFEKTTMPIYNSIEKGIYKYAG